MQISFPISKYSKVRRQVVEFPTLHVVLTNLFTKVLCDPVNQTPVCVRTDECECLGAGGDGDDEAWHGGAAEVDPAPLGQQHHPLPVRPDDVVHLRTDLLPSQVLLKYVLAVRSVDQY